jgi:hypothetical protein
MNFEVEKKCNIAVQLSRQTLDLDELEHVVRVLKEAAPSNAETKWIVRQGYSTNHAYDLILSVEWTEPVYPARPAYADDDVDEDTDLSCLNEPQPVFKEMPKRIPPIKDIPQA